MAYMCSDVEDDDVLILFTLLNSFHFLQPSLFLKKEEPAFIWASFAMAEFFQKAF